MKENFKAGLCIVLVLTLVLFAYLILPNRTIDSQEVKFSQKENYNFHIIGNVPSINGTRIGYFEDTNAMYIVSPNGNFTPFYDPNGNIMLYK